MMILGVEKFGKAGLRVYVDEKLPNGHRYLDLFSHNYHQTVSELSTQWVLDELCRTVNSGT